MGSSFLNNDSGSNTKSRISNILIKQQSGFRKSHSCETALNPKNPERSSRQRHGYHRGVPEFEKAFETTIIKILLQKLQHYGITEKEYNSIWQDGFNLFNEFPTQVKGSRLNHG
jgi:hypothetical protein